MKTLILAAATATFLGTAGITTEWLCGENGLQLNKNDLGRNGIGRGIAISEAQAAPWPGVH
jgi:hypothetical protein